MLTAARNHNSLTFYQPMTSERETSYDSSYVDAIDVVATSTVGNKTAEITNNYNTELNGYLEYFQQVRASDASNLNLTQPNQAARNRGVYRAWQYEKADISMGGSGSENWSTQEKQDILDRVDMDNQFSSKRGVREAEGHHQRNVADHPEDQANPDNIKFYRTKKEHLEKGHHGNWSNESDAPMTDKDQMLRNTNNKRVRSNELNGLKLAVAIGMGVGFTIGFAVELAKGGITPDSVKNACIAGTKSGVETGVLSTVSFGVGRTIGDVVTNALVGGLTNCGFQVTENIAKMCSIGALGMITISIFSVYQFVKLKLQGISTKDAAIQIGKQALFSTSLLAVSIVAQGIWGGAAGIIVSTSIGIIVITYSIKDIVHQRKFSSYIREYMIERSKPIFGGA